MRTTEPRILICEPCFPGRAVWGYQLLGLQAWVAGQLRALGGFFPVLALDTELRPGPLDDIEPPSDGAIGTIVERTAVSHGLLMAFDVVGEQPHLMGARLAATPPGRPVRTLAEWKFEDVDEPLPVAANRLCGKILKQLGSIAEPPTWQQAFGTTDVDVALDYLKAFGCHLVCEDDEAIVEPKEALRAALSGVANGMSAAVDLFPVLIRLMHDTESAPDQQLRAAVDAALAVVGAVVPTSWATLLNEAFIAGPHSHN